jgi:histidyl-tRNA synthetase
MSNQDKKLKLSTQPLSSSGESKNVSPRLSVEAYKGTRDFYPRDQFIQNYIFGVWRKVAESFGYLEYNASILEETKLYRAKSGDEIVNEQTYSFTDRGGRDVTIRPEMTPTVARMVAQKRKELTFPLRWFSIPNLFRYERPQRGRLREHWQLNVDMFGVESVEADIEILKVAYGIMKSFGAGDETFEIRVNDRRLLNYLLHEHLELSEDQAHKLSKLIDKMHKMSAEDFLLAAKDIVGDKTKMLEEILYVKSLDELGEKAPKSQGAHELQKVLAGLKAAGISNFVYDPTLVRGFDYYTGVVFEVFDCSPVNNRSVFGGGRYDDLVGIFGVEKVPGVGFGAGDVTIRDFLETHSLLPEYRPPVKLYICHLENYLNAANELGAQLRASGLNVVVDITERKVSQQVKTADKESVPFVLVVGEEEVKTGKYKVKNLKDGKEVEVSVTDITKAIN